MDLIDDDEDFEKFDDKMKQYSQELKKQMTEGKRLDEEIKNNLKRIGYSL